MVVQRNIVIIGAGEIGQAIGRVLKVHYNNVVLYDNDPAKVSEPINLPEIMPVADVVFFCVPSWALRQAVTNVYQLLKKEAIVICLAKGIEDSSRKIVDELLQELLPVGQSFAILGGPMLAEEIDRGLPAYGVVGTDLEKTYLLISDLFQDSNVALTWSRDVRGVALAGVLKNIYTFAIGFVIGLEFGSDVKGEVAMQSLREMMIISERLGGKKETMMSGAGLGDFIATSFSAYSRNLQTALEIIRTGHWENKSEGLVSLEPLLRRLVGDTKELPLLRLLALIILDKEDPRKIFAANLKKI